MTWIMKAGIACTGTGKCAYRVYEEERVRMSEMEIFYSSTGDDFVWLITIEKVGCMAKVSFRSVP